MEALGFALAIAWYIAGLVGSQTLCAKGYSVTTGSYLWGGMLGVFQLLLAKAAPDKSGPQATAPSSRASAVDVPVSERFAIILNASAESVSKQLNSFVVSLRAQLPGADAVGKQLAGYYLSCTEVIRRGVAGEGTLASKVSPSASKAATHGRFKTRHVTVVYLDAWG